MKYHPVANRRVASSSQKGSALLIVFLFAAILAISLYMEMPIVVFEAKRAKEQLLIDRGDEYAHAVKLYYRKFRTYPASIDALVSTNNMRFLRHKYKDPMTGEADWRLLHAGPGGQLTDSKVNPVGLNANGTNAGLANNSASNGGSSFGSSTSAFGSSTSSFGSTSSGNAAGGFGAAASPGFGNVGDTGTGPTVAGVPQRPPEMPTGGSVAAQNAALNADPTQSLLPPLPTFSSGLPNTGVQNSASTQTAVANGAPGVPIATALPGSIQAGGQLIPQAQAASGSSINNPMQGVQGLFANPNPIGTTANSASAAPLTNTSSTPGGTGGPITTGIVNSNTSTSTMGVLQGGGGIAGVASVAKGTSIKAVNDQHNYSLWEFYYDPTKDTAGIGQSGINPLNGVQPPNSTTTPTPFGSTNGANSNSGAASPTTSTPTTTSTSPPGQQ